MPLPDGASSRTGCRVDLGGGTLDIWPLGLLSPHAVTTNVAIDVEVAVEVRRRQRGYRVSQAQSSIQATTAAELRKHPDGELVGVLADALELGPVEVWITSASPRGGGLGASSALTVSLIALAELLAGHESPRSTAERVALARDLEAATMGLPTGTQDFYPPLLGGALALHHRPGGTDVSPLEVDLEAFGASLLVMYSGSSHFSAGQNWRVVRRRLDGDPEMISAFDALASVSAQIPEALERGDLERVGRLMGEEWCHRRQFGEGVETPRIRSLLAEAEASGAWGGKACGAGGGGCVAVLCPPERRDVIADRLADLGGERLAAAPRSQGLAASVTEPSS